MKEVSTSCKDARARSTAEQTDDDYHPAHDRQLSGAGREKSSPGADGRGAMGMAAVTRQHASTHRHTHSSVSQQIGRLTITQHN